MMKNYVCIFHEFVSEIVFVAFESDLLVLWSDMGTWIDNKTYFKLLVGDDYLPGPLRVYMVRQWLRCTQSVVAGTSLDRASKGAQQNVQIKGQVICRPSISVVLVSFFFAFFGKLGTYKNHHPLLFGYP